MNSVKSEFTEFRIEFGIGEFEIEIGRKFWYQNFKKFRFQSSELPISISIHTPNKSNEEKGIVIISEKGKNGRKAIINYNTR